MNAAADFLCEMSSSQKLCCTQFLCHGKNKKKKDLSRDLCAGQVVTEEKIQEAKLFYQMHFKHQVFDEEAWRKVLEVWSRILCVTNPPKIKHSSWELPCQTWMLCLCVRDTMVASRSGSKLCQRAASYHEATFSSLWRTLTLLSSGSPTTWRCVCFSTLDRCEAHQSEIIYSCCLLLFYTTANKCCLETTKAPASKNCTSLCSVWAMTSVHPTLLFNFF